MERFSLKQVETFYRVAECGSFQAAASHLNTTQPAVSVRIKELERALGVELFDRSTRQARLTPRGRALLVHARRLLVLAEELRDDIAGPEAVTGLIRLGVADTVAMTWLPQLVERIAERFPRLGIELEVNLTVNLLQQLQNRAIDIAILVGPVPTPVVSVMPLGSVRLEWMASPRLNLPRGPVTADMLARLPIITYSHGSHQPAMIQQWFRAQGVKPRRFNACTSMATIVRLTACGLGLSVQPADAMQSEIQSGALYEVETTRPFPPNDFVAAFGSESHSALLTEIAGMAKEAAAAHPAFAPGK